MSRSHRREGARRKAETTHEVAGNMALIGETAGRRRLRKGRGAHDELARKVDGPLDEVGVGREAERPREASHHLKSAETAGARQFDQGHRGGRVVIEEFPRTSYRDRHGWMSLRRALAHKA